MVLYNMKILDCWRVPPAARPFKLPFFPPRLFPAALCLVLLAPVSLPAALESLYAFSVESLAAPPGGAAELFEGGGELGRGAPELHLASLRLFGLPELACHSLAFSAGRKARWAAGLRAFGPKDWQEHSLLLARSARLHPSLSWRAGLGLHRLQAGSVREGLLQTAHLGLEQRWSGGGLAMLCRFSRQDWRGLQGVRLAFWQTVAGWEPRLALRSGPEAPLDPELGMAWRMEHSRYEIAWLGERGWRGQCSWGIGAWRVGVLCWLHPVLPASLCFSFACSLPASK